MSKITLTQTENGHALSFRFNPVLNSLVKKTFPGAAFSAADRGWRIPHADPRTLAVFVDFAEETLAKEDAELDAQRAAVEAWREGERIAKERRDAEFEAGQKAFFEAAQERDRLRGAGSFLTLDASIRKGDVIQRDGRDVLVLDAWKSPYISGPEAVRRGTPEFARTSPFFVKFETATAENLAERDAEREFARVAARRLEILQEASQSDDIPVVEGVIGGRVIEPAGRGWRSSIFRLDDAWLWHVLDHGWTADDGDAAFRPTFNYGHSTARRIPATDEIRALFAEVAA
ncbi:hypothetical protein [Aureimonas endophytica]|nr:hypothetical protein [Aureimonas endophytica]